MNAEYFVNADITLLKTYDSSIINKAFEYISTCGIEFKYPQGGCQQRAHLISLILTYKFNIEHCKLWLFSPAALTMGDYRPLYIRDPNNFTENDNIEWNFHVAPVLKLNSANGMKQVIIDPSLDINKPLELTDFFFSIGNSNISKYTFLLPDKYFFNTSTIDNIPTNLFDGSFIDFDDCAKNDLTMEKGLASNNTSMEMYYKYVQPLLKDDIENGSQKLNDLKAIFGNATAADLLIAQNISGYLPNTTHRYATTHYPEIMQEARAIFYKRLSYWTAFTNSLISYKD